MKIQKVAVLLVAAATLVGNGSKAEAQGFSAILEKLERFEGRLNDLESSQKQDIGALRNQLASVEIRTEDDGLSRSVTELQTQLNQYAGDLETVKADAGRLVTVEDVGALTEELRDLVGTLRLTVGPNSTKTVAHAAVTRVAETPNPAENSTSSSKPQTTVHEVIPGKVSGYMFGDYYYLTSTSGHSIGAVKGDLEEESNGFAFRRIYLEYNRKLNAAFTVRLRLETADAGFGAGSKMEPFVKHAYLKHAGSGRTVYLGLAGTPTWSVSEKVWGYRAVEKTIMDLHKIGSSADLGIGVKSDLGDRTSLHLMFGNGPGQKPEQDKHKKIYLQLATQPTTRLNLVGYADWEGQSENRNKFTVAGLVSLDQDRFRSGLEGFARVNQLGAEEEVKLWGISAFGTAKVLPRVSLFSRLDLFDPDTRTEDDQEYLIIAGLDWTPLKDVHLMPNLWLQTYRQAGIEADVVPRVTAYYKF